MKSLLDTYTDVDGQEWDLTTLDKEERRLVADLQRRSCTTGLERLRQLLGP